MPCRASQVVAKFSRDSLANLTPTFFRQCIQMHAALPPTHVLFTASVETVTITPTHARLLAVGLHQAVCSLQRLGAPLPRPISQLGLWHHFKVATRKVEAIDFVDGVGGYLVADHIPGLWDFVRARAPAITWQEGMRGHLVPFRCHGHDALELEHLYHCPDGAHHLGYRALCAARRIVARAVTVSVHTAGEVDIHGRRLVCTIVITTSQGMSTSLGECLLRAGLSYPLPGAPVTYTTAFSKAQASRSGVFSIFPPPWPPHISCTRARLELPLGHPLGRCSYYTMEKCTKWLVNHSYIMPAMSLCGRVGSRMQDRGDLSAPALPTSQQM